MRILFAIYLPIIQILAFKFHAFRLYSSVRTPSKFYILDGTHLFTQTFFDRRFILQSESLFAKSITNLMTNFLQQLV